MLHTQQTPRFGGNKRWLFGIIALIVLSMTTDVFAQQNYSITMNQRRRGDQIGVDIWVKGLRGANTPKLGSMTFPIVYNTSNLVPADQQTSGGLTSNPLDVTDSIDADVNQAYPLPYRTINTPFSVSAGYLAHSAQAANNGTLFTYQLDVTFNGNPATDGYRPDTSGRGSYIGTLVFDIINHASLTDATLAGIALNTTTTFSDFVILDANGNNVEATTTVLNPTSLTIRGITILNPNGPNEAVNRSTQYASLGVAGYPIYFERSGLITPSSGNGYGTNVVSYVMEYSLDGGGSWTSNTIRVAETNTSAIGLGAALANHASGELEYSAAPDVDVNRLITTPTGAQLTTSGDGYGGIVRIIWKADPNFSARSEIAKIRLVQLSTTPAEAAANITNRTRLVPFDVSDFTFPLGRLFFLQLNGSRYLRTSTNYSNATQLTVEAWVNLDATQATGADVEPGIVASGAGLLSGEEGAWMLYLHEGRYPAFRAREILGRGPGGYISTVISPDELSRTASTFPLGNGHASNWQHIAATVSNNTISLYVNGELVARKSNDSAVNIRMMTTNHPIWIGVNPTSTGTGITASDYLTAGIKEVRVWRTALPQDSIRTRIAGVGSPNVPVTGLLPNTQAALELYFSLVGSRTDLADNITFQNGGSTLNLFTTAATNATAQNQLITYRPDRPHIRLTSPSGGEGIVNLEDRTFEIRWASYGLGSLASGTPDVGIEFTRNSGADWVDAIDSTTVPSGLPLNQVDVELGRAIWEPYNNINPPGSPADLQAVVPLATNYSKQVQLRVRGADGSGQESIEGVSGMFTVAPFFAFQNASGTIAEIQGTSALNISGPTSCFEAWVRPHRFPSTQEGYFPIFTKMDSSLTSGNTHYALRLLNTGQIQMRVTTASGDERVATSSIEKPLRLLEPNVESLDSAWTHVAVFLNLGVNFSGQSQVRFYIDGNLQFDTLITNQLGTNVSVNRDNRFPAYIGYEPAGTNQNIHSFIGDIKEVRFWNGTPRNAGVSNNDPVTNPDGLTNFLRGAQAVRADELLSSPVNNRANLVAAFTFNGGPFVANDVVYRGIASTNPAVRAVLWKKNASKFAATFPYIKVVDPVFNARVRNNATRRVRWVGFDYDRDLFRTGNTTYSSDLEFSTLGGGGVVIQPYQATASDNYAGAYTDAFTTPTVNPEFQFDGTAAPLVQFAGNLNIGTADPDLNNDGIFNDQGAIASTLTNARLRLRGRSTVNSSTPFEYTDIPTLRSEGPLFTIIPPSNFTARVLLEGLHDGDVPGNMRNIGTTFSTRGMRLRLYESVANQPGVLKGTYLSEDAYSNDLTGRDPSQGAARGNDGSQFANVPFIIDNQIDGEYFAVLDHINHLPIMSRVPVPFKFSGDDLSTWEIESGWDFQAWGQNSAATAGDVITANTDDVYAGAGKFTAFGNSTLDPVLSDYATTALMYNDGMGGSSLNPMAAMVGGDINQDGQINAADRAKVRVENGCSGCFSSDVTGDGFTTNFDRDIVDRNNGKQSSLRGIIPGFEARGDGNNGNGIIADGGTVTGASSAKGGEETILSGFAAGLRYTLSGDARIVGDFIDVDLFIKNDGEAWGPGNCTFAINFNPSQVQYEGLFNIETMPFSNNDKLGYARAYGSPTETTPNPLTNVRTIEIDYLRTLGRGGLSVPNTRTRLGTLRFKRTQLDATEYEFSWNKEITGVLRIDGGNVTGKGKFEDIPAARIVRTAIVKSPNGGELWRARKIQTITWTNDGADAVHVEFSADNGQRWTRLSTTPILAKNQEFAWQVPNIRSKECLVRLVNPVTSAEYDRSDATFEIGPPSSAILYPTAETNSIQGGTTDRIDWITDEAQAVRFEYSANGADNWINVTGTKPAADATTPWLVPTVNTCNAVVRMVDAATDLELALSDRFRIVIGAAEFISPKPGTAFKGGQTATIRCNVTKTDRYDLWYSVDGGKSWVAIQQGVSAKQQSFNWKVPSVTSENVIIRASAVGLVCAELGNTSISIDTPTDVEEQPLFTGDALVGLPAPNPFTNETSLDFTLPVGNAVTIEVFDAVGKRIAVIAANEMFAAGQHSVRFDADMLPNGMYTIRFASGATVAQRSVVIMR